MMTKAGRLLADRISPVLAEARAALQVISNTGQEIRGVLKLSVPGAAGIRYSEHLAQVMIAVPMPPRTQQIALGASPSFLAERGMPAGPREPLSHDVSAFVDRAA